MSNATLWPLLWLAAWPVPAVALTATAMTIVRLATALDLQRRLTCSTVPIRFGWLVWLKDLAQAGLWAMAFMGKEVEWRGECYQIQPGGTVAKKRRSAVQRPSPSLNPETILPARHRVKPTRTPDGNSPCP